MTRKIIKFGKFVKKLEKRQKNGRVLGSISEMVFFVPTVKAIDNHIVTKRSMVNLLPFRSNDF